MVKQSIKTHRWKEIEDHKWIESEKAGRDLGEDAIYSWIRNHWQGYFRARWLEHLQGKTYWIELDSASFGSLSNRFQDKLPLFNFIVDRFKAGAENVHIIWWAVDSAYSMDDVHSILEAININSTRIGYRFDE